MLVAAVVLALYFWAYFNVDITNIGASLLVSDTAAVLAGAALAASIVSYLWAPKKYIFWGSLGAYCVLCLTSATLILNTGGTSSPFLALWMAVAVFAGVFGMFGLLPLAGAIAAYLAMQIIEGAFSSEVLVAVMFAGLLPLGASYLIWRNKAKETDGDDRAYRELASELSQVAGKSEVVINAIADGVIALDSHGVIQLINPAAQQIIGWGKQDALSLDYKSVLKLVDANDAELTPANDPISQTLATNKETAVSNLTLITNSGKKILVSIVVSPVGQPGSGVIVVFRDVTMEKREERQQAEFISTAAHEMRTPVASIEGYLGLALNPNTAQIDEKARDFINKAHASAQHLGRLFQDLLDVSKAEDGRLSNNPKVVDIVAFAHDITQGLRQKAEEKGLRVIFKPQPGDDEKSGERRLNPVYYANVDNDHLREVFSNLVENAIKYTPSGDVTIDVQGDNEHVTISVADSGIGIPKEDQAHLFQKFYRVDNSETREIGGTGLGLYLSRRLTEAMNGRIWVESEYKRGSTFYVELPRLDHEEAQRLIESAGMQEEAEVPAISPAATATPLESLPPANEPAMTTDETVYTNTPVKTVVQQLQAIPTQQPQAVPPPVAAPPTPPAQPAAAPVPPQPQQPAPAPQQYAARPPRPNVPLASIEKNPHEYIHTRPDGVPIPPRGQK